MQTGPDDRLHLGYCTSIHPARGWPAVLDNLRAHAPLVKARLSPGAPFGLGLRLSGQESFELLEGDELPSFRHWLDAEGLYVFTLNAFPHGSFHGGSVKDRVHAPDWTDDERVEYTLRMGRILAGLLPEGAEGSISTSPLSYAPWFEGRSPEWSRFTANLTRVAEGFARIGERAGVRLRLAIEPEADGLLGDCTQLAAFFADRLLAGGPADLLREHIGACFDACHAAVAFERPEEAVAQLQQAGIAVAKVQLSSALVAGIGEGESRGELTGALAEFTSSPYLHQVTERAPDGATATFLDLPEALDRVDAAPAGAQWRVHCHVPIFVEDYGGLRSTQDVLRDTLRLVRDQSLCTHLEIETYTWSVLPEGLRANVVDSIVREYEWVLDELG